MALVQPGAEGPPTGAGPLACRVELRVDPVDAVLDEGDDGLVVRVRDGHPRHALVLVLLLLALEDRREEELLQLLVGEVDAELLEGVDLEPLEAVHVEQPDVPRAPCRALDGGVDPCDDEGEEARVPAAHGAGLGLGLGLGLGSGLVVSEKGWG